ncbi:MAG: hypothetical protein WD120_02865, partial [Gemmatimonadota bacterium]
MPRRIRDPAGPLEVVESPVRPGDRMWMARALEQARQAGLRGEVPVGAVVVRDSGVIAEGMYERAREAFGQK